MKHPDCTVLVVSCDAYADTLPPFIALWHKFWPDCPFETVLLTETIPCPGFDRILPVGKCNDWAPRICRAISQINTPYVLLVLNDYYLSRPIDTTRILKRLEEAKRCQALNLRLVPNPAGRKPWEGSDLLEMPKNVAYCITCQVGIWNKDFFAKLLSKTRSAWEFERYGSFMVADETRPLLVTKEQEFPFIDAVHKGYWEKEGLDLCQRNGIPLDLTVRGRPPFRVKAREALKSLIFALFPWALIVRIQNLFNIGMKERSKPAACDSARPG